MLLKPNSRICMNMPFCTQKRLLFFIWTQLTQIKTCDLAGLGLMHHAQVRGFHYRRGTAVQVGHFSWNAKGPIGVFAVHAETYGAIAVFYLWFDGNVGWLRAEVKPFRVAEFCSFLLCCVCEKHRGGENTFYTWSPQHFDSNTEKPEKTFCKDGETQILCIVVLYAQSQDARKWCHLDLQTNWFWFGGKTYQLLWSIWNLVDVVFLDVSTHIAAVYFVPRPEFWPAASTVFFWSRWYWYHYVGISINGSTQVYLVKWSILGVLLGTPINGHTHIIII